MGAVYPPLAELHADLFSRHASPLNVCAFWRSTKEVKRLCPTRFVIDATGKKEAWRPKCAKSKNEQNQKATYHCPYLGHQNEVTFVGGISERCPTNITQHPPTFQCEAMRVSAKPSQSGWVGIGRWVWVKSQKLYIPE